MKTNLCSAAFFLQELLLGKKYTDNEMIERLKLLDLELISGDLFYLLMFRFEESLYHIDIFQLRHLKTVLKPNAWGFLEMGFMCGSVKKF